MEDIWKVICGLLTTVLGWFYFAVQRNNTRHEKHDDRINTLEKRTAVSEEQYKHVLEKLEEVLEISSDLKKTSATIIRALVRKSK